MSNQQQQALKQQLRHPISLGQFDTSASQMFGADQPLSPTNIITSSGSREGLSKPKDNKQKQLKGPPSLVGLSMLEYGLDDKMNCSISSLEQRDLSDNYLGHLYEGNDQQIGQILGKGQELYSKLEVSFKLPFEMVMEQIELQLNNYALFTKYIKVLRVDKTRQSLDGSAEKSKILIKGGFQDQNKKLVELNTCGITSELHITFLFNNQVKQALPNDSTKNNATAIAPAGPQQEKMSDKIHNELYPLLQGSEEDIDELDDEVAMISNKKGVPEGCTGGVEKQDQRMKDSIEVDDIQFQLGDGNFYHNSDSSKSSKPKVGNNGPSSNQDDEVNREFNTFPRNYGESSQQVQHQMLGADSNQNSGANINTNRSINQEKNLQNQKGENIDLYQLEQEIFGQNSSNTAQRQPGWHIRLLQKCITQVKVIGFNSNHLPAITNMTQFINSSMMLKKEKMLEEAMEIDFMVGMLMISTKRTTQASEVLRKIQASYLYSIQKSQLIMVPQSNNSSNNNNNTKMINFQQQQYAKSQLLVKCAVIELLVAESMNQASQVNDKILALKRMVDLSTGKMVPIITYQQQIFYSEDPYTAMTRMLPKMLKFVILCMTHKKEVVRLSALKQLEFILETQGCSLDSIIVLILQTLFRTYPGFQSINHQHKQLKQDKDGKEGYPQPISSKEPNSGFITALKNLYSHVLDTYISVLSSISSHILHQLFYEVIMPFLVNVPAELNTQPQNEIKVFAIKIAEKIITICQGDLILSKVALDQFLAAVTIKKLQSEALFNSIKNLWMSIRSKVFTNYSQKGMKILIEWLVEKMSQLSQGTEGQAGVDLNSSSNQDIAKLEITDEQLQQLSQLIDIVSLISIGRRKAEEEANSLIKIKQDYCQELYLLVNPLLFWLDFSVEREDRLNLFKAVYQTIKDVINNLPPKRVDLDVLQIMIPILQRVSEYLKASSPSLNMLKFLDLVLIDIKDDKYCQQNPELQYFFLEMLNNYVSYISYCLYEEAFTVFDKLLAMSNDVVTEKVLTKCIIALVDKYTVKSKAHKNSLTLFMKSLMEVKMKKPSEKQKAALKNNLRGNNNLDENNLDEFEEEQLSVHSKNNYFEILTKFCFFNNHPPAGFQKNNQSNQTGDNEKHSKIGDLHRNPVDLHDLYIDKLQLFIDSLSLMNDLHINMFTSLITHPKFKVTLTSLLSSEETTIRLKCHEILEIVTNYYVQYCTSKTVYELAMPQSSSANGIGNDVSSGGGNKRKQQNEVMEVEFVNHERLYLSQIVVQCVKMSLDAKNDSYLQFNSLILLDFLFQNLLPVPTYQNELFKNRGLSSQLSNNQNQSLQNNNEKAQQGMIDLETLEINESTLEYEVTEQRYINMRLNLIFKLWPYVQHALNSAWSNIRSICYGLICSMLKIDIRDYLPNAQGHSTSTQQHFLGQLKQLILPMLNSLLSSKESESKAGGLNILGSFCGLSYDFSKIKISKNLEFFKKNTNFVTNRIWQLVYDLQDDWDITIKEASVVLIQLCAPRGKIIEFDHKKRAKENAGFTRMLNKYGLNTERGQSQLSSRSLANQYSVQSIDIDYCFQNPYATQHTNSQAELLNQQLLAANNDGEDLSVLCCQDDQQFTGVASDIFQLLQNKKQAFNFDSDALDNAAANQQQEKKCMKEYSEYDQAVLDMEEVPEGPEFQFFVDAYQDDQIQEIISIFRNDFKPPKNLWIEKNPSAAYNSPDYYAEIYSQAIEQFNQQQMHLQQQSQQQMQQQVSNSPKAAGVLPGLIDKNAIVGDALEDDLVKRCEKEQLERERQQNQGSQVNSDEPSEKANNFLIFERHFEDGKEGEELQQIQQLKQENILQNPTDQSTEQSHEQPSKPAIGQVQSIQGGHQQLQIIDEEEMSLKSTSQQQQQPIQHQQQQNVYQKQPELPLQTKNQLHELNENNITNINIPLTKNEKQEAIISVQGSQPNSNQAPSNASGKQTADELIEEYERKINKTIQLLEEEKKKVQIKPKGGAGNQKDQQPLSVTSTISLEPAAGSLKNYPEPKSKRDKLQENSNYVNVASKDVSSKNAKKQAQSYLSELSKGHLTNIDNMKLIKQINNCFGDNLNSTAPAGAIKNKQKLNKSFENLFAQNKSNLKAQVQEAVKPSKKNLSSSPKRGSLSGKKNGQGGKVSSQNRKKYLDQSKNANSKALYNMRDLNFFIKTIEKDLSEKFNKLNMKDFSSVPTTPTSILKKVEEQVKAQAQFKDNSIGKAYMSNTCPNIAQILGSLDTAQTSSKSNHALQIQDHNNIQSRIKEMSATSNHTPSNVATHQNIFGGPQTNNFVFDAPSNNFDKSSFSKTQKLDLKDVTKGLFSYPYNKQGHQKEGNTQREYHEEGSHLSKNKTTKFSPKNEDKYSNLMKQIKEKAGQVSNPGSKRGKGSQDKYRNQMMQNPSSSSSQSKLNKSANNIGSVPYKTSRKEPLSKSFINMQMQAQNVSPHAKKNQKPILLNHLTAQGNSVLQSVGMSGQGSSQPSSSQYSHSNDTTHLYDYNQGHH